MILALAVVVPYYPRMHATPSGGSAGDTLAYLTFMLGVLVGLFLEWAATRGPSGDDGPWWRRGRPGPVPPSAPEPDGESDEDPSWLKSIYEHIREQKVLTRRG
jgi:hypothetical protein